MLRISVWNWSICGRRRTSNLDFVPQLQLGFARCRFLYRRGLGWWFPAGDSGKGLGGEGLERLRIVLLYGGEGGRYRSIAGVGSGRGNAGAAGNSGSLLLLQLVGEGFDGEGLDNVFGSGGEEGEHGVAAVFLVLLEASVYTGGFRVNLRPGEGRRRRRGGWGALFFRDALAHHPAACFRQLVADILDSEVAGAGQAEADDQVGAVAPKEVARAFEHGGG